MGLNANFNIHKIATALYCIFLCVFYFPGKFCLKAIETKGEIIMPTVKDAIIMIKNSWKQVNIIFLLYLILRRVYIIL
jgi:hypothetical protein